MAFRDWAGLQFFILAKVVREELLIIVRLFPPYLYLGIFSSLEFAILQYIFVHLHFFSWNGVLSNWVVFKNCCWPTWITLSENWIATIFLEYLLQRNCKLIENIFNRKGDKIINKDQRFSGIGVTICVVIGWFSELSGCITIFPVWWEQVWRKNMINRYGYLTALKPPSAALHSAG